MTPLSNIPILLKGQRARGGARALKRQIKCRFSALAIPAGANCISPGRDPAAANTRGLSSFLVRKEDFITSWSDDFCSQLIATSSVGHG